MRYCKTLIEFVNDDINNTCKIYNINRNYSSHSFRVNYITEILKQIPVHKAAHFIGHKNIQSTLKYNRYSFDRDYQADVLDKALFNPGT